MNISLFQALGLSVLGFAIVFCVLMILMWLIGVLRGIMEKLDAAKAAKPAPLVSSTPAAAAAPAGPPPGMIPAMGSLGEIKLHDVDDKTAALIMAIVADELKAPLNELRFLSIREKKK